MAFVKDFLWGAATAAYQIEGAWNEDEKSESIWDSFCHNGDHIKDKNTGDIACDHYHRFKEDVALMAQFSLKAYRFSIAWSRIFTFDGTQDGKLLYHENPKGIAFYNELIDELIAHKITPFVTLYHWDLPLALYQKGGWLNRTCTDWFEDFAHTVAKYFGDRVKNFITFNEPSVFVGLGYKEGVHAPGYKLDTHDLLRICFNVQLAHGKAVRILRKEVKDAKIGITLASAPVLPEDETKNSIDFARNMYFECNEKNAVWSESFWLDSIVFGKYPKTLLLQRKDFADSITKEDLDIISSKIDFVGLNIYVGRYANESSRQAGCGRTNVGWDVNPTALYWGAKFFYERYKLPIYITESGIACHDWVSLDGKVHDPNRIDYLNRYLLNLRKVAQEKVDIRGYFQWSLIDNFEWAEGFNPRFGMVYCDYKTQKRIPKDSAAWYKKVIESNGENL